MGIPSSSSMKTVDWLSPVLILSALGPRGKPSLMEKASVPSATKSSWISIATSKVEPLPLKVTSMAIAMKSESPVGEIQT